jgi:hypothetical protein
MFQQWVDSEARQRVQGCEVPPTQDESRRRSAVALPASRMRLSHKKSSVESSPVQPHGIGWPTVRPWEQGGMM